MRAKPIFTHSLLAGALALSGHALALGLGKLTVDSSLGQPLSARIDLTSVTKDDLDSLRAKVADPSLYRQNNLTYQATLSRARISLENGGGTPYLKVTSPVPVQEPFLDLLVELDWASGRVVREYTFLLDPPGVQLAAPTEPVTPARAGTPARTAAAPAQPAPTPASSTTAANGAAAGGATNGAAGGGNQYEVRRGDTLQKIATQYKPADATLDQMLAALFSRNESAFEGGNMNRLRAGSILTIPSAADAQATAPAEASRLVHMQASDWRSYRDRVAAAAPEAAGGASREATGRIGAAVEDKTPAAAPGSDKLRVSREAGTGKGAGAAEDAIARDQQLKDAQSRIAALEKTIAEMQRAVELKNQTLAQLQAQAEAAKGGKPAEAAAPSGSAAGAPAAAGTSSTSPAATADAQATPAAAAAPATEPKAAEASPPATPPATASAKAPAPKAATPATKTEPAGFFADLFSSTPNWVLGVAALAILGGIAGLVAARRRKATKFEDSIISGTDIKTNTVFGSTGGGVVNTGENSLASDFSREGLGNIDTDEVDPIAEAEVYLAYGRDAQAEEILKDALKKDPQRQEIYLKLLEIHSQHNKPQAFETVASELFAVSHGQGDVWHKAVTLGRQLDPNNPMFQDAAAAQASAAPATAARPAATAPGVASVAVPRTPAHAAPAFSDGDISIAPHSAPAVQSAAAILAGAEDALARSPSTPVAAAAAAHAAPPAPGELASDAIPEFHVDLPNDLAHDETRGPARQTPAVPHAEFHDASGAGAAADPFADIARELTTRVDTPAEQPRFDLDFHLDDADRVAPLKRSEPVREPSLAAAATAGSAATHAPSLDLEKLDLSFDSDHPVHTEGAPSVLDGQWHDAATKLDLAKAYQEMGDVDGAREILQEVLHEGDDQQKSEANSLLAKLSA
jgi:pilus assembly protein FimV